MKKIGIVLSIIFLSFFAPVVLAQTNTPEDTNKTPLKERLVTLVGTLTEKADYFASGETVILSGTVKADAYVAGGQIIVDGTVDNDLLAACGTLTLNGKVGQDARLAGGNLIISGEVGNNLTVFGGNIEITSDAEIGGNLVISGGNVTIAAPIKGNITGAVGNLTIANTVDGNIDVKVGQLTLSPKANIQGNLSYQSPEDALISPEATVAGTLTKTLPPAMEKLESVNAQDLQAQIVNRLQDFWQRLTSVVFLFSFINALVVGFLFVNFFPNLSYQSILSIEDRPWRALVVGLVALLLTPLIIILSLVLLIGLSLGSILAVTFAIYLYLAKLVFSYWLGARFIQGLRRMAGPGVTMFVGLGLYYLLSVITYVGPVVRLLAVVFGLGAFLIALRQSYLHSRVKKIL